MNRKRNRRSPANVRRVSVCLTVVLLLLLSAAAPVPALSASAEGGGYRDGASGIEAEPADASAVPPGAALHATVGRWFQIEPGASGVAAYLDDSLYWQQITLHLRGDTDYSGSAVVRIPLLSDGGVDSVKAVVLPPDPAAPNAGLIDAAFSVAGSVLTVDMQLPAYCYIGASDPNALAAVPGDALNPQEPSVGEQIGDALEGFRDGILDWWNGFVGGLVTGPADRFNEFLRSDWTAAYRANVLDVVNAVYRIIYPFGVFIAIIAWAFGVAAAGFTLNLDPGNKYSILRAVLQLLIGLTLLSAAPQLLMIIFSIVNSLKTAIVGQVQATSGHTFIQFVFSLKIYLSMALLGTLQCVSPLFLGTAAGNESTRRFAVNFLKAYGLCCLEMVLVTVYVLIVDRLESVFGWSNGWLWDLLISIVLSVSVFTIDRKFERTFQ